MAVPETTESYHARIAEADNLARCGEGRMNQARQRGYATGIRSCGSILTDRDTKTAELISLRSALGLGPRESILRAVIELRSKQ